MTVISSADTDSATRVESIDSSRRQVRVAGKEMIADSTIKLTLEAADGRPLPAWEPGDHIEVVIPGEPGLVRQYSLCGDLHVEDRWSIAVLREQDSRGGSSWIHETLQQGDCLEVGGPNKAFPLVDAEDYLFIAGGIGITPLLPMMQHCTKLGKNWRLAYLGKRRSGMAFADEVLLLGGSRAEVFPRDTLTERVDLHRYVREVNPEVVYCCGPGQLLDALEEVVHELPSVTLRQERFRPRELPDDLVNIAFTVHADFTGISFEVAAGCSIVEAAAAAGIDIPSSCNEGTCGTCETTVLDGIPDHRDSYLTADEQRGNDVIMPCCSRATTDSLTLDL